MKTKYYKLEKEYEVAGYINSHKRLGWKLESLVVNPNIEKCYICFFTKDENKDEKNENFNESLNENLKIDVSFLNIDKKFEKRLYDIFLGNSKKTEFFTDNLKIITNKDTIEEIIFGNIYNLKNKKIKLSKFDIIKFLNKNKIGNKYD